MLMVIRKRNKIHNRYSFEIQKHKFIFFIGFNANLINYPVTLYKTVQKVKSTGKGRVRYWGKLPSPRLP